MLYLLNCARQDMFEPMSHDLRMECFDDGDDFGPSYARGPTKLAFHMLKALEDSASQKESWEICRRGFRGYGQFRTCGSTLQRIKRFL